MNKKELNELVKISGEEMLFPPPDFSTHLNYVSYMNTLSKNVNLSCNLSIKNRIKESKILKKKINLLKLTLNSIKGEYQTIQKNPDYAEVCVSWISVKSYYLIFNLMLILNYLIAGQEISFDSTHKELIRKFKECIKREEFSFNKRIFNTSFKCSKIMNFKIKQGANIKILNIDSAERLIQILKKIVKYKFEDFQRKEKIKNFRSKKNKQKKKEFLKNNTVNIWEFFYWYRIKANYRDLEFLNKNINSNKFKEFYKNYFELTLAFYNVYKKLINDLAKKRLGKIIL